MAPHVHGNSPMTVGWLVVNAQQARSLACSHLADDLPQRWRHVQGVARRASRLGQVSNRPSHPIRKQRLPAAWQHNGPIVIADPHLGGKAIPQVRRRMRLPVLVNGQARPHERLEIRNRHRNLRRNEQTMAGRPEDSRIRSLRIEPSNISNRSVLTFQRQRRTTARCSNSYVLRLPWASIQLHAKLHRPTLISVAPIVCIQVTWPR